MIYRATGSKALDVTFSPNSSSTPAVVTGVLIHLSAAATATADLNISIDSGVSTVYDTIIGTVAMSSVQNYAWYPDQPLELPPGDQLAIAWVNDASSYKTWGLSVLYRQ
jgi:hypothetical protein